MSEDPERKFVMLLINLYRNSPVLWNTKSKFYLNKKARRDAVYKIINVLKRLRPDFDAGTYKKKINVLRTNFNKEHRKIQQSKESGNENVYEPTLWYYNELQFIKDQDTEIEDIDTEFPEEILYINSLTPEPISPKSVSPEPSKPKTVRKMFKSEPRRSDVDNIEAGNFDDIASDYISEPQGHQQMDSYTHWALSCAADLKKMDPIQQIFAKKAISDIIMEGQLGKLRRNSFKINDDLY